ncbi:MAG: endonuclease, partial [Saprospiraceae bacterium]
MFSKIVTIILFVCITVQMSAQQHQDVFPGLSGQELLDALVSEYKPTQLLPQAQARDTLFGKIDNHNDSLTCVYTGFTIWLDPAEDPTQAAYMNGGPDAINTEHTYPQSLGATGAAAGDMHHLYPTRADVNAGRGNSPFAEIPDSETDEWYYLNQSQSSVPVSNIDLYSERTGTLFEPREDHKGNVARSMMYFYTMYKAQADQAGPVFFEVQRQTLCAWHFLDPVDETEWNRTWKIAEHQSGKPNPFVLDCTLPERTYCGEFGMTCTVATSEQPGPGGF